MTLNERAALLAGLPERYYIYSGEHGAYWGPNCSGYVYSKEKAGEYSKQEADNVMNGCGPEKLIEVTPVPAPKYDQSIDLCRTLLPLVEQRGRQKQLKEKIITYYNDELMVDNLFWRILTIPPDVLLKAIVEVLEG